MVTAMPANVNATLIMSMMKIARIMDVSTQYMYRNNFHFWVLKFSKSSTDGPYILEGQVLGPYKDGPYKTILYVIQVSVFLEENENMSV